MFERRMLAYKCQIKGTEQSWLPHKLRKSISCRPTDCANLRNRRHRVVMVLRPRYYMQQFMAECEHTTAWRAFQVWLHLY